MLLIWKKLVRLVTIRTKCYTVVTAYIHAFMVYQKIPKPGIPLRPIVSFVNSPTYAISGYPARILSPVLVILITLKIPINLVVKVAKERLREDASLEQRTSLHVEDTIHLLSFCLKTTQFAYNGTYYHRFFKSLHRLNPFSGDDMYTMLFLRYPEMKRNASYRSLIQVKSLFNLPLSVKRIDICPFLI